MIILLAIIGSPEMLNNTIPIHESGTKPYDHISGIYRVSCKLKNSEIIPLNRGYQIGPLAFVQIRDLI